jgi:predicted RNA-binding Zn ribbon-like protein
MTDARQPSSAPGGLPARLIAAGSRARCLDFANTLCWRGLPTPTETLRGWHDLSVWCAGAGGAVDPQFVRWSAARTEAAAVLFAEAIAMREVLYRVFAALSIEARIPSQDLRALNEAMARAPARAGIAEFGAGYAWRVDRGVDEPGFSAPELLAPVLWSAADLLVGDERANVRQCANEACRWLFLDASRSGSRRWCDMRSCGNRAKAQRHYHKHRGA